MSTLSLFDTTEANTETLSQEQVSKIRGLHYIADFITPEQEQYLLQKIDQDEGVRWSGELQRRVQHYGYKYDYKARRINAKMQVGELPRWLHSLSARLLRHGYFEQLPDQVIVNEYLPGQGISPHIDCVPCFEDTIASLSLGSGCVMDFSHPVTQEKVPVLLHARSLVVLKDEARFDWRHGIAARRTDKYNGAVIERKRRVSLTFRRVILSSEET